MTPLELVQGAAVRSVTRRAAGRSPVVEYEVIVTLPAGGEVKLLASSATAWRRVVKKAQLRLVSSVAREAAAALRERIAAAVEAEKASPSAHLLDSKVIERANKSARRREEKAAEERRRTDIITMRSLMVTTRISREELLELWNSSVLADVMST